MTGQTPVLDQGMRPTCAVMALTAAHEYARAGLRLSVEHLWANTADRGGVEPAGARIAVMRTAAILDGQCEEHLWSYDPAGPVAPATQPPVPGHVIADRSQLLNPSLDAIRTELAAGRPPILIVNPNTAFLDGNSPINASAAEPPDAFLHAVVAVGYNDAGQSVTVRNSWGTSWGDQGYANLSYRFLRLRCRRLMTVLI